MSKRKNILVYTNTKVFKHPANAKHNEVTVVVKSWAIPVRNLLGYTIPPETAKVVLEKMRLTFPKAKVEFNYSVQHPAFLFDSIGKTMRKEGDKCDAELGEKVAGVKSNANAYSISRFLSKSIVSNIKSGLEDALMFATHCTLNIKAEKDYLIDGRYINKEDK
jgi:hypothetical protein